MCLLLSIDETHTNKLAKIPCVNASYGEWSFDFRYKIWWTRLTFISGCVNEICVKKMTCVILVFTYQLFEWHHGDLFECSVKDIIHLVVLKHLEQTSWTRRRTRQRGVGDWAALQNNLNLEKLGKFLSNYAKIRTIFGEIREKTGNLNSQVG